MINNESPVINGDGTYSRDFTYISNAINANILSLETSNSKCYGKVFNIGAGGQTTILNLAYFIKKEIGYHGNIILGKNRVGDIPHSNADISLAQNMLGYNPNINFEAGLRKTIKYFLDIKVKNVK
jgi:UDP-N-acetylglucosamine 4-epimerase